MSRKERMIEQAKREAEMMARIKADFDMKLAILTKAQREQIRLEREDTALKRRAAFRVVK